ncbi:MAG: patatin-like phospholipase family protein, partial [Cyanobacteria bacterium J06600_6]
DDIFLGFGLPIQTEIYRLIIIEGKNRYGEAFVSTAFVSTLSGLIWYSGRLLQIERDRLSYSIVAESDRTNNSSDCGDPVNDNNCAELYLAIIPRILGSIPLISLGIGIFKSVNGSVSWLFLLLFFGSIVTGVFIGIRKLDRLLANAIVTMSPRIYIYNRNSNILGFIPDIVLYILTAGFWIAFGNYLLKIDSEISTLFADVWIAICALATVAIILLFIYRRGIFGSRSSDSYGFLGLGADSREGLFGTKFECVFINIAYILFCALSLPIIAADSTKTSFGVIAVLALGAIVNAILLWWRWGETEEQRLIFIFSFISLAAFIGLLFVSPTIIVNKVGAISIIAMSLSIFVVIFSTIYHWGIEFRIPTLTVLICILLISSFFNWNDNHRIRQLATSENRTLPTLEQCFREWSNSRQEDIQDYNNKDKPYPVYLVSAQGGGIFAAYHAATALSKIQDSFPDFSQHIFAISSVSGGSLGAAAFSSLVKENIEDVDRNKLEKIEPKARALFGENLLSPLLSMGLFPDFVQRFLFFPIYQWDRAKGLEIAFEEAWNNTQSDRNPLRNSYYAHWNPKKTAPALVLNATEVETGEALRISPFFIPLPQGDENIFDRQDIDFRLSTAAGISARFPFVTPVAWYTKNSAKFRLADGGYFDNSGVSTALDIGRTLQKLKKYPDEFEIIYISITDLPNQSLSDKVKTQGLNEVGSPIRTVFNVRSARGKNIVKQAKYLLNDGSGDAFQFKFRNIYLDKQTDTGELPLGWLLSKTSRDAIDKQNISFDQCNRALFEKENDNDFDVGNHNSCVAKSIGYDLKKI